MEEKIKIIELESKIIKLISKDNFRGNTVHFEYSKIDPLYKLSVITHSPITGQNFLLHTTRGGSNISCLEKMVEYVSDKYRDEYSWSVSWVNKNGEPIVSYFRGVEEDEIRNKFEHMNVGAKIKSITRMPLS